MPIDFPNSPSNGQSYTVGDKTWTYNGSVWILTIGTVAIANSAIDVNKIDGGTATNGYFLRVNTSANSGIKWESVPVISNINDIGDVVISNASVGQIIKFNGTNWVNDTDSTGTTINTLNDVGDVVVTGNATGQFLKYDSTNWVNDTIDLGTDTTGNYVATITGTANEITVTGSGSESASVTLSLPANVTIANNLTVTGDLTVNGNTTTLNTANLNVEDNFILLNSGVTGSPNLNAGIQIERGTSADVDIRWNETSDKWEFTVDGTNYTELGAGGAATSSTPPSSPTAGSLWFDSDDGKTYVYYDSTWVEIGGNPQAVTISDTAPSNPISGQVWYKSDNGATYIYYDSYWVEVGGTSTNVVLNTIDAKGDIIVGTADNTISKLSVGSNNTILAANSSTTTGLEWRAVEDDQLILATAVFL